jgi:uncharacterized DUF497 family protein
MYKTRFSWDSEKEARNMRKHGLDFSIAARAFADPFAVTEQNRIDNGELRWRTLALVDGRAVLLVAHTLGEDDDGTEHVHIVSARTADRKERRYYDECRLRA